VADRPPDVGSVALTVAVAHRSDRPEGHERASPEGSCSGGDTGSCSGDGGSSDIWFQTPLKLARIELAARNDSAVLMLQTHG
jgi:hypothetical protein